MARCTVECLMRRHGLRGVVRGKVGARRLAMPMRRVRWTGVRRQFKAQRSDELWVLDFHVRLDLAGLAVRGFRHRRVCPPHRGAARVVDDANGLRTRCLEQALWARQPGREPLIHDSDRGSQYVSIRYSERLAEAGIEPSVGSKGDSYDNALAETINGLYKAELIHRHAPWKTKEAVEFATLEWVAWFNHQRLLEPIGYIPPAKAEANYLPDNSPVNPLRWRQNS